MSRSDQKKLSAGLVCIAMMLASGGCATLAESIINSMLNPPMTVSVEITGRGQSVEFASYTRYHSDSDADTAKSFAGQWSEDFLKQPYDTDAEILYRNRQVRLLPVSENYSLEKGDRVFIFCKPYAATGDIIITVKKDGKFAGRRILAPDDIGVYMNYDN